jgi:hypothetical protein
MTDLPVIPQELVRRILTMALKRWADERGGAGSIEDAALYFGVDVEDIRLAIQITGALDIRREGEQEIVVVSETTKGRA